MFQTADFHDPAVAEDGIDRVVVLPDLQNYTGLGGRHFGVLRETIDWVLAERERLGIRLVLQVGDLTDRNRPAEWRLAREALGAFEGRLPCIATVGNHDLGETSVGDSRFTRFNDYFAPTRGDGAALVSLAAPGEFQNRASTVHLAGEDWLVLALEFGPRQRVVEWAAGVLDAHRDLPTLLVTHEFVDQLSRVETGEVLRSRPGTYNCPHNYRLALEEGGVHGGEELWQALVRDRPQVRLVVNGHYRPFQRDPESGLIEPIDGLAEARRVDRRPDGSTCEQLMFNAQWAPRGGDGWMLLLEIAPGGRITGRYRFSPLACPAASTQSRR